LVIYQESGFKCFHKILTIFRNVGYKDYILNYVIARIFIPFSTVMCMCHVEGYQYLHRDVT